MNVNELYKKALDDDTVAEKDLFAILRASFKLILQHKNIKEEDAEDIVQDAIITISGKYKHIEEINNFSAWSYVVLRNKLIDYFKVKKYAKNQPTLELDDSYSNTEPEIDRKLLDKLIDCFRQVSQRNRKHARILNLNYLGFSTSEICKKLQISHTNMYSILSRARSLLKYCLERGMIKK